MNALSLHRADALLLVVDVQERLMAAMPQPARDELTRNAGLLLRAAQTLSLPVVASEQYPKGLGHTVPQLRELLPEPPLEKLDFSCARAGPLAARIAEKGRRQVVVAGMEAHVCVFQTVRDLVSRDYAVFVAQDAVISRTEANRGVGLRLCEKAGATITSTETIVFDLLGAAGTAEFKALAPLIR